MSGWLEALLGKVFNSGVSIPLSKGLNFTGGLAAALNPSTKQIDVTFDGEGAVGPTGPQGATGATGPAGPTGPAGDGGAGVGGLMLVLGQQHTEATTWEVIGAVHLTADEADAVGSSVFRVVAKTTDEDDATEVRLFDRTANAEVAGSLLSFTNEALAELTATVSIASGSRLLEVQMQLATTGNPNQAFAYSARLTPDVP